MVEARPRRTFELDSVASLWQVALDGAQAALNAAGAPQGLPPAELDRRRRQLVEERQQTAEMLARLAATTGVRPAPWLSPMPVTRQMLGLPPTVSACVFDLDGVLTDSAVLHASAWAVVFDDLLLRLGEETDWPFKLFDPDVDYSAYLDGRPRLEGIHTFLGSRGIRLPEGRPDDPADAKTAYGLANHKTEVLARGMHQHSVTALPGARRYLEAAGHAGLKRAAVSASASMLAMLEQANLAVLVEAHVDADTIRASGLRSRPAPDLLLAACRQLDVPPDRAVTLTHSPAGVAAGHAAGIAVIGVAEGPRAELLRGFGAEHVVPSLGALLERQFRDTD